LAMSQPRETLPLPSRSELQEPLVTSEVVSCRANGLTSATGTSSGCTLMAGGVLLATVGLVGEGSGAGGHKPANQTLPDGPARLASVLASSSGVWKRSPGSLAISRRTTAATGAGTSGRSCSTGVGSYRRCLISFSIMLLPGNGTWPLKR